MTTLTGKQIDDEALDGWVQLLNALHTRLPTGDFATGLRLVNAIGAVAEELHHHPDLNLRYTHLDVRLTSHDAGGVTARDVELARRVGALATAAGITPGTTGLSRLELALDTPAMGTVRPFWAAVLAGRGRGDEVTDPGGVLPNVWFQESGHEEPRQRWHLDVWLDPAEVESRMAAAIAAGGTLVSDAEAPNFWVLADPEGNRVCLCTWQPARSAPS